MCFLASRAVASWPVGDAIETSRDIRSSDREGARPHCAADASRPLAAVHEPGRGTFEACQSALSAYRGRPEVSGAPSE